MISKPKHFSLEYAEQFKDFSIVEAYRHRPPYPAEVFDILVGLIQDEPRRVLDIGCGTGNIARNLVDRVDAIDAVDFSQHMIEKGKSLPNGNSPHLRWLYGSVEEIALAPPYALVTAGASLHWMDWNVVLPRLHEVLMPNGYLAIIEHNMLHDPWFNKLGAIIPRYSTNKDFQDYDMIDELEKHGLFQKVGQRTTTPVPFVQSIEDYIESFHSRNGFSRERMDPAQEAAFDQEARAILLKEHTDGMLSLEVVAEIVWGKPEFSRSN